MDTKVPGAVNYENGDWCGTPLHQFRNYVVRISVGAVSIETVMALAQKHGALCFHRDTMSSRPSYEVHFVNTREGRKAAHAFNRDYIHAWNGAVHKLAPPKAELA